jgi:endonuclease/exonuclease/phosphatase family metal-dependent hydrolase
LTPAPLRILVWNLFHGRAVPPAGRSLLAQFASQIAGWEWDVALLQEVPPWWSPELAASASAQQCTALTSRNAGLALRRLLARSRPDLMKSNGGGANALLARQPILEHHAVRLRRWPERRVALLARLDGGECLVNVHLSTRPALARTELEQAWALAREWAGSGRLVLGGDLNLREPGPLEQAKHAGASAVDHVFARGWDHTATVSLTANPVSSAGARHTLSDHRPLLVELTGSTS